MAAIIATMLEAFCSGSRAAAAALGRDSLVICAPSAGLQCPWPDSAGTRRASDPILHRIAERTDDKTSDYGVRNVASPPRTLDHAGFGAPSAPRTPSEQRNAIALGSVGAPYEAASASQREGLSSFRA